MIYDCFPFFNELDLLDIRLNVLAPYVDKFVISEAAKTHTGKDKPLYFEENRERFKKFEEKIIYIRTEFPSEIANNPWECENYQRNALARGLEHASTDDWIILSDLDEIPDPDAILKIASTDRDIIAVFDQRFFTYFLNCEYHDRWCGSVMSRWNRFKNQPLQNARGISIMENALHHDRRFPFIIKTKIQEWFLRTMKRIPIVIMLGGWHFTCIGTIERIREKLHAVVETSEIADTKNAADDLIVDGKDIRTGKTGFTFVPIDNRFPAYIRENAEKYKKYLRFPPSQ